MRPGRRSGLYGVMLADEGDNSLHSLGGGDLRILVVDVDEAVAVAAHLEFFHVGQLPEAVAALHPLHQIPVIRLLQGVNQVHGGLVDGQDVQGGQDSDVGSHHGMAAVPSQSQETDMFRRTFT